MSIDWIGTYNGVTSNTSNIYRPSAQEQIRDAAMNYLKTNHNSSCLYQDLSWTGRMVDEHANRLIKVFIRKYWNDNAISYSTKSIYTITINYVSSVSQVRSTEHSNGTLGKMEQ